MEQVLDRVRDELDNYGFTHPFDLVLSSTGQPKSIRIITNEPVPAIIRSMATVTSQGDQLSLEIDLKHLLDPDLPDPPQLPSGPASYYIYAPYSGLVVDQLPTQASGYVLVKDRGLYEAVNGAWVPINSPDPVMFYDERGKRFYTIQGTTIGPALTNLRLTPGDLFIDGAKGRVYIYDGQWDYDPRGSLKTNDYAIRVTTDSQIPWGPGTIFADPGKGSITLTLPKLRSLTSPKVSLVNISDRGRLKIKSPDKIFVEAPTIINSGKSVTYQAYNGTWYQVN